MTITERTNTAAVRDMKTLAIWGCSTSMYMNIKHTVYKIPSCSPSVTFSTMPTVGVAVENAGVLISDEYVYTIYSDQINTLWYIIIMHS